MDLIKIWFKYNKWIPVIKAVVDAVKLLIDAIKKNDALGIDGAAIKIRESLYKVMPDDVKEFASKEEADAFLTSIDDAVYAVKDLIEKTLPLFKRG